ncbi:MAG: TatD family hydrolase [Candidatus Omnitrophica bacterium]|nr:TatD family hydrolase [Candidatus Omnitrophota bacterium]
MWIDTHCHLERAEYDADREAVIERALGAGVELMVTIGTDAASSRQAVELAERHASVVAAVGIHPHEADHVIDDDLEAIQELSQHPKVVAVGEIGLDYYKGYATPEHQQRLFERQLDIAHERQLPVLIHCREAFGEVVSTLQRRASQWRGIMHCFAGDASTLSRCLDLGLAISFAGPLTFKNGAALRAVAHQAPLDRIVIETDAPFLAPHPLRGSRNEPAHVRLVGEELARLHGLSVESVAAGTTRCARQVLGLPWNGQP